MRRGDDVRVKNVEEAREILDSMPELKPGVGSGVMPQIIDPPGTYRGDLINKDNPMSPRVHEDLLNRHGHTAHFNLTLRVFFPDGSTKRIKPAIMIDE